MLSTFALLALPLLPPGPQDRKGLEVRLSCEKDFLIGTDRIHVTIEIEALKNLSVSPGLFTGQDLSVKLQGMPLELFPPLETEEVRIPLKKGTRIRVEVPISIPSVLGKAGLELAPGKPLDFEISAPQGNSVLLKIYGDFSGVPIEKFDMEKTRVALITNFGNMILSFRPDKAPGHVKNFIELSKKGFYDGTLFHRVIKGFMLQGGDPNTKDDDPFNDGQGSPGYNVDAEFNDIKHVKGILSMARGTDPNSAGCQFFIMHGEAPHLDGKYTVFGKLEKGIDVLDKIGNIEVEKAPNGEFSKPVTPVILKKALVLGVLK